MRFPFAILGLAAALAACTGDGTPPPAAVSAVPVQRGGALLDRVIGQTAPALTSLFGAPVADIREGPARKLQYGNATCVLDAYLYPKGRAEPTVSYVDARQPDGSPIDRASCVGALQVGRKH
ncbi:hypothetical protein [Sphingomonas immobilis]|uniref:Lipoprotein n=1 Tax=Sphingomonas immobilis TaxID=3063997 RepID=A0ABT9A3P6_9SPHN|nr:hypothetical protein [Sphingomonas sp. CA1-15]MDO7844467.1 hypothetical protein [Sphingomonas sp. CA1-15]